ncbi:MAG: DMT family transporter [Terriglobales bacterium]
MPESTVKARGSGARGYGLIAAAACCWGASAALGRAMFTGRVAHPVSPLVLTQMRITLAALVLLAALAAARRGAIFLPARQAWAAVSIGIVGMTASNYFYYLAIERTCVAVAIIIQYTAPIWVLLYLVARGRQRATPTRLAAVALALAGIALVLGVASAGLRLFTSAGGLDAIGVCGALLAAFAFAYYNIAGERLVARADPILVSLYMLVGAAVFMLAVHPPWLIWRAHYGAAEWRFFGEFSLLATLVPTLLYISGLRILDPTRAVVTSCLEPVSGILLAAVFLGEQLGWTKALGVACVLAAIVLVQRPSGADAGVRCAAAPNGTGSPGRLA